MYSTCALSQAENDGAGEEHHNHIPNFPAPAYHIKNFMLLWLLLLLLWLLWLRRRQLCLLWFLVLLWLLWLL